MKVSDAIAQRISTRGFLPESVDRAVLQEILGKAQYAPSGGNLQPWRVIALTGEAKQAVINLALQVLGQSPKGEPTDRPIYPDNLWAPYQTRRRAVGEQLYAQLGIPKENKAARLAWFTNNFHFFGAPIALFFILDKRMGHGQWAHTGMYMQTIALLAEEYGLASCMQECWGILRPSLKAHFNLPDNEMVYCAMALGKADPDNPVNHLRAERADIDEVIQFFGFE